ncbi:hypothetical protein F5Y12DRAFT_424434 [Xylaria sp. FL1777]|nr:hypothetical protein F5Y12DRAFT_424434 [Xylaria sp. FL1777]
MDMSVLQDGTPHGFGLIAGFLLACWPAFREAISSTPRGSASAATRRDEASLAIHSILCVAVPHHTLITSVYFHLT